MLRYEWTSTASGPTIELDPLADAISLAIPFTEGPPSAPRAFRVYDRGACSGEARWRDLADRIFPEMDERVDFVLGGDPNADFCFDNTGDGVNETCLCGAMPSGNWTVTPQLREDLFGHPLDTFRLFRAYTVHLCGGGWVGPLRVAITGAFGAQAGRLVYKVVIRIEEPALAGVEPHVGLGRIDRRGIDRRCIDRRGIDRRGIDRRGIVVRGMSRSAADHDEDQRRHPQCCAYGGLLPRSRGEANQLSDSSHERCASPVAIAVRPPLTHSRER